MADRGRQDEGKVGIPSVTPDMVLCTNEDSDPDYVPPKKPYSFLAMLDDILVFASETLVDGGRLSFWTPTANDEELEIPVPTHPCLEIVAICVQPFNKCKPRLSSHSLTYHLEC